MHRIAISLILLHGLILSANCQPLYVPRNIKRAQEKGTRTETGQPGKNYWQNAGRYKISLSASPPDRTIRGNEQIWYYNNSPDTLRAIVIKLFLNVHKAGAARNAGVGTDYLTPGIGIDSFAENDQPRAWDRPDDNNTWRPVRLKQALRPGDSVRLFFRFHYELSRESNREGMIDSTSFFLAYFYPRVAVHDDYYGWDRVSFNDQQEFYNDFNNYDLSVSVPRNFLVWATGTLDNASEVLNPEYQARLTSAMTSDSLVRIVGPEDLARHQVTGQRPENTWHFIASDVPDVALGISDHFVWDASSVLVDTETGRRARLQAAYNDTAKDFHQMIGFSRHAVGWFSKYWPGIPYPYPVMTVFQGYADMEYPMMVNEATDREPSFSQLKAEHEIAHSWFPFFMGTNESRYAFMDEGWAVFFEFLIGAENSGRQKAEDNFKQFRAEGYTYDRSAESDLPIITPANELNGPAYEYNAYGKPAMAYLALKDLLGDALFRKSLLGYMNWWHGRHPTPWDFFYSINTISGMDLDWFWNNWFFTNNYVDLGIGKVSDENGRYNVMVRNIGGFAIPFDLCFRYSDGGSDTVHFHADIWKKDAHNARLQFAPAHKKVRTVELLTGIFLDADEKNNKYVVL